LGQRNWLWFGDRLARQNDHENRSQPDFAADRDMITVVFDQFSGQRQPQPDASLFGREVSTTAVIATGAAANAGIAAK
jgi:hypothetical protein